MKNREERPTNLDRGATQQTFHESPGRAESPGPSKHATVHTASWAIALHSYPESTVYSLLNNGGLTSCDGCGVES